MVNASAMMAVVTGRRQMSPNHARPQVIFTKILLTGHNQLYDLLINLHFMPMLHMYREIHWEIHIIPQDLNHI
jgi:hypothetical protein